MAFNPRSGRLCLLCLMPGFCLALGCSETQEPQDLGSSEDDVIGGVATLERPEVGLLKITTTNGGAYYCTATLIAPSVIIAAGHCVRASQAFNDKKSSQDVRAIPEGRAAEFMIKTADSQKHYYPIDKYIPFDTAQSAYAHVDDISVLHLSVPVDLQEVAFPSLSCGLPSTTESLQVFGLGCSRIGAGDYLTKRKRTFAGADTSVDETSGIVFPAKCNVGASNTVTQPGLLCPIDSGGPVFNEAGEIVGISSGGNGKCSVFALIQPKYVAVLRALTVEGWATQTSALGWQTLQKLESLWATPTDDPQVMNELTLRVREVYSSSAEFSDSEATIADYNQIADWYRRALTTNCPGPLQFERLLCEQPTSAWQAHWSAGQTKGQDTIAIAAGEAVAEDAGAEEAGAAEAGAEAGAEDGGAEAAEHVAEDAQLKIINHHSAVHWMTH